jgi:hypothetical protein
MSQEGSASNVEPEEVALLPASSLRGAGTPLLRQHTFGLLSAVMDGEDEEGGISPVPSQSGHSLAGPGSVARPPPSSASRLFSRKHSLAAPSSLLLRSSSAAGPGSPASPRHLDRHSSTLTLGPDADSAAISESVFDDHGSPKPLGRPLATNEEEESAGSGESAAEAEVLPHRARVRQAHVTLSADEAASSKRLKRAAGESEGEGEGEDGKERDENEEHDAFAEGADEALNGGDADDSRSAEADDDGVSSNPDPISRRQSWMDSTGGSSWRVF